MNQAAPPRPLSASPPTTEPRPAATFDKEVQHEARQLDDAFKALARRILIDDDPASELPLRQFRVCAALFEGAMTMKELSRRLGVSQSAVTQLADRLESAGMVRRGPADDDRRVRQLELTDRARKLMRIREQRRLERVMQILERMAVADRESLVTSMLALKDAAAVDE